VTTTQNEELFRRYMAEQADAQTRQLRRIADNTAATRVAAIVLLDRQQSWGHGRSVRPIDCGVDR
jgi:hypothetical protein